MKTQITFGVLCLLSLSACVTSEPFSKDNEAAASYNLQLGMDYMRQGNLSQAKEKLDRSLQQNPKNAQAYVAAGMLYDRIKESRKADQYFAKAVALDPKNGEVVNSYAAFLCRKGEHSKGEQMAVTAANNPLYQTPELAWYNAGNCALDAKENSKAEQYFRHALAVRADFSAALLQLAEIEFQGGNLLSARGFMTRYLQSNKSSAASLWLGVRIERAAGNSALADDYARRLKQDFPTATETKALLALENKKTS